MIQLFSSNLPRTVAKKEEIHFHEELREKSLIPQRMRGRRRKNNRSSFFICQNICLLITLSHFPNSIFHLKSISDFYELWWVWFFASEKDSLRGLFIDEKWNYFLVALEMILSFKYESPFTKKIKSSVGWWVGNKLLTRVKRRDPWKIDEL